MTIFGIYVRFPGCMRFHSVFNVRRLRRCMGETLPRCWLPLNQSYAWAWSHRQLLGGANQWPTFGETFGYWGGGVDPRSSWKCGQFSGLKIGTPATNPSQKQRDFCNYLSVENCATPGVNCVSHDIFGNKHLTNKDVRTTRPMSIEYIYIYIYKSGDLVRGKETPIPQKVAEPCGSR